MRLAAKIFCLTVCLAVFTAKAANRMVTPQLNSWNNWASSYSLTLGEGEVGSPSITLADVNSDGWITSNSTFSVAADLPFAVLADVNSDGHIDAVALGYNNDVATIATNYPTFTYITNTSGSGLELMQ